MLQPVYNPHVRRQLSGSIDYTIKPEKEKTSRNIQPRGSPTDASSHPSAETHSAIHNTQQTQKHTRKTEFTTTCGPCLAIRQSRAHAHPPVPGGDPRGDKDSKSVTY